MKKIKEVKRPLGGELAIPGDKSIGHRAVIFTNIAHGRSRIWNLSGGEDNLRTVQAFKDLGVKMWQEGETLCVEGEGWERRCSSGNPGRESSGDSLYPADRQRPGKISDCFGRTSG